MKTLKLKKSLPNRPASLNRDAAGTHHHWEPIDALEQGERADAIAVLTRDITRAFSLLRNRIDAEEVEARIALHG